MTPTDTTLPQLPPTPDAEVDRQDTYGSRTGWEPELRRPRHFAPRPGWEYRDFTVRLDVHEEGRNADRRAAADVNPLVRYFLRRVAAHGWEPDEPCDFETLFKNDRVAYRSIEGRRWVFEVTSVTVRLRRPLR